MILNSNLRKAPLLPIYYAQRIQKEKHLIFNISYYIIYNYNILMLLGQLVALLESKASKFFQSSQSKFLLSM